ncbi:MAG: hypothetical protein ACTSYX_08060 [Candidatus Thorarchaeota archaeon]
MSRIRIDVDRSQNKTQVSFQGQRAAFRSIMHAMFDAVDKGYGVTYIQDDQGRDMWVTVVEEDRCCAGNIVEPGLKQ